MTLILTAHRPGMPPAQLEQPIQPIAPTTMRFIRLGQGGEFARDCINQNVLALGFSEHGHEACIAGDWDALAQSFRAAGKTAGTASNHVREIRDFYTLGADTLWITFAEGKLWWAFAEPEVAWHAEHVGALPRRRRIIGSWRCEDIHGNPIFFRDLSTRLTQLAGYRGTICAVAEADYVVRRINGEIEPLAREAQEIRTALTQTAERLIAALHWRDFEVLVDQILAASGWHRVSELGRTQADIDLEVEQAATRERAFVQVKSKAGPQELDDYITRFREEGRCNRMFFICHSPSPALRRRADEMVEHFHIWFGPALRITPFGPVFLTGSRKERAKLHFAFDFRGQESADAVKGKAGSLSRKRPTRRKPSTVSGQTVAAIESAKQSWSAGRGPTRSVLGNIRRTEHLS